MATLASRRIGFVGLGLMGKPMARHLLRAGAELIGYNRSRDVMTELAAEGMRCAKSPREVAQEADITVLMLSDTPAVETVLFGKDGVLAGLRPNGLVIDMGTTAATETRRFAAAVVAAGGAYLDAPVSGGQVGAAEASLTIMVGGSADALADARPVLEVLGKRITHVGEAGAGQVAKAANQVIVGLTIGAVAEALTLAKRSGVDPAKVREALAGGFAWSRILELHGQRMIDGAFAPGGKATTQRKDIAQALELARAVKLDLPATALNLELYDQLIANGDGQLDHSALVKVIDVDH